MNSSDSPSSTAFPINPAELVRDFIETVLNGGHLAQLERFVHQDYRYRAPDDEIVGINAFRGFVETLLTAFPDLRVEITDQITEGLKVCTQVTVTGTQLGDFNGIPPTRRAIKIDGVIISQLDDGRIRQEWELLDQYAMLRQLELLPEESAS